MMMEMDLSFNVLLAKDYKSKSQIARVLTEEWFARNMYCPICGEASIQQANANAPVKDFICDHCKSQYELKSKKSESSKFSTSVNDGMYETMIQRITSLDNPSFFFMHYDSYKVNNLIIVPKCFFTPALIDKRKPLSGHSRRAGWEGCSIRLGDVPQTAKIPIIIDGEVVDKQKVITTYNKVYSLQKNSIEGRGWVFDVLSCIEKLDNEFTLQEMYSFVHLLKQRHPDNNHVEDKIRQQLQLLRDKGLIEFKKRGHYRKIK